MFFWWARPIIRKTSIPASCAAAGSLKRFEIHPPDTEQRVQLLSLYLNGARLEPGFAVKEIAERLNGFAPADIQAICNTAKRMAFNRLTQGDQLPPLNWSDFRKGH